MSGPTPLVSIIVPFFDPGRFLPEAVDSVLAQSFADWELLLVDDGSTDGSERAARGFAERDSTRIRVLAHAGGKNRGVSATRNLGLGQSRGEFVALLDADDVWLPQKLERQLELASSNPGSAMIFGRSQYWHSWNANDSEPDSIPQLVAGDRMYEPPELWKLCYPYGRFGAPCPSDLLIRRSVLDESGGFEECFDQRAPTHEDIALLSKLFLNFPVYVSNECWDRYRRHDRSAWARALKDGGEERSRQFYFGWMRDYLEKTGIKDSEIWSLLGKRTWRYRHPALARCLETVRAALRPLKPLLQKS
jgi:glycosyltransferase involved in cell wall biosynthesis